MGSNQNKEPSHEASITSYGAVDTTTVGMRQSYIYVLLLNDGKYYVGRTYDVDRRVKEHTSGRGAEWTSKYSVVRELYRKESDNAMDEDREVESLMIRHGVDNVRGGIYSQIRLDQATKDLLQKKTWHAQDKCIQCGGIGHYIKDCPSSKKVTKSVKKEVTKKELSKKEVAPKPSRMCTRCGRNTHNITRCYAKTHLDGTKL